MRQSTFKFLSSGDKSCFHTSIVNGLFYMDGLFLDQLLLKEGTIVRCSPLFVVEHHGSF